MDLNADLGERPGAEAEDEALMRWITSANIACGGHAGDPATMAAAIAAALRHGVRVGAHPGYPDREHFGRRVMALPEAEIAATVELQVRALSAVAAGQGATIGHVKPHGALYNLATRDAGVARAIAAGVARWRPDAIDVIDVILFGLAGSIMLEVFREAGFRVAAEAFADRRYEPDGSLRSRALADALIDDPQAAAAQARSIAVEKRVSTLDGTVVPVTAETLCIHGDTAGAPQIAAAVRQALDAAGVVVTSLSADVVQ